MQAAVVESAVDGIITIDERGNVLSVNPACEKLFGYRADELIGSNVSRIMPPPYRDEHDGYLEHYLATGEKKIIGIGREVEGRRKDGSTFPIDLAVSEVRLGKRRIFAGVIRDISDRRRAEAEVRSERDRAQRYLDVAAVIMVALDTSGRVTLINQRGCEILGRSEPDIIGKDWFENFLPERLRSRMKAVFLELVAGNIAETRSFENPVLARSGEERLIEWQNREVRDASGKIVGTLSSGTDVTERREAEESLRLVRTAVEHIHDSVVVVTTSRLQQPGPEIVYVNPAFTRMTGYSPDEALGRTPRMLQGPKSSREELRRCRETLEQGRPFSGEIINYRRDGTEYLVEWNIAPVKDADGRITHFVSIQRDITEKKKAEAELLKRRSLAQLGEMAAMVAHEVKNPLAAILGALDTLRHRIAGEPEREVINEMMSRVVALNDSVNDVLIYSRPTFPRKEIVPLRVLLEDTISFLADDPQFREVDLRLTGEEVEVPCDVEMLKPVFVNLMMNAAQAMEGKGQISVELRNENSTCTVCIHDSGPGIDKELLARVFEPFYTTRAAGTGLGLSIAKRVVELHGGEIAVDCPADGGTRVVVRIPLEWKSEARTTHGDGRPGEPGDDGVVDFH